jgi:hypothetical protein
MARQTMKGMGQDGRFFKDNKRGASAGEAQLGEFLFIFSPVALPVRSPPPTP